MSELPTQPILPKRFAEPPVTAADGGTPHVPARARLSASDAHRLSLQTKLTEYGIPPEPEDRGALRQLAALDDVSVDAVIRWLTCAAGTGTGPVAAPAAAPDTAGDPTLREQQESDPGSAPAPAPGTDPRLIAW